MSEDTEEKPMEVETETTEDRAEEAGAEEDIKGGSTDENKEDSPESPEGEEAEAPEAEEEKKEDSADADADANPESKEEPMEDDDRPDGPTLQVSVAPGDEADGEGDDVDDQAGPTLQFTFQQNTEDVAQDEDEENEKPSVAGKKRSRSEAETEKSDQIKAEEYQLLNTHVEYEDKDPQTVADKKTVRENPPESDLEHALSRLLTGKENHVAKLTNEIKKLKGFISKRKQTYKRKRKDEGAPTRALSAYNIFVQDQFAKLAKKNSAALQSTDTNAQLERVPPANLVASTGNVWKNLPEEEKQKYRERAKSDRKRYEEQMAKYQPPDKAGNRKRNKTGYNMFFSAHVLRLKQSELGVPSERGSVARLVGTAWKQLSSEEKQYYEREADKHNGMNPVDKAEDEDGKDREDAKEAIQQQAAQQQAAQQQAAQPSHATAAQVQDPYAAHAAAAAAAAQYPHDITAATGYAHAMHQAAAQQHDPRWGYYAHPAQTAHAYHYDYSGHGHHQPPPQPAPQQHPRGSRGQYQYGQQAHGYYDK